MLKDVPINKTAITIEKILHGELICDTYNLRLCFYDTVIRNKVELEASLKELEEKGMYDDKRLKDTINVFEEKISIYNRYLELLEQRENMKEVV